VRGLILLRRDAAEAERIVRRCAPVPMHPHEFDAAVSLAYTIGGQAFCGSTVARRFNAGDYEGACNAFLMWDKFRGRTLPGLVARRERERLLCLGVSGE
jgi:lysozyme